MNAARSVVLALALAQFALPLNAQAPAPAGQGAAPPAQGTAAQGDKSFSQGELDQLLAPVALYPDALLAQVLMAATYPLDIVAADRWAKANPGLKDKALEDALAQQPWDPSVKSLVVFPQVLTMMSEKLDWTQKLGDAFLGQQQDVMATAQALRQKASAEGNLKSSDQQQVVTTQENNTTVIKIEPTNPEVVYVPTYNPTVVYGAWPYPAYPPYYYYPPGYIPGAGLLTFTAGVAVGAALWGNCNWGRGDVNVNVNRYNNFNRSNINNSNWQHNANRRGAVPYRDQNVARQNGRSPSTTAASRDQFRGRAEAGQQAISRGDVSARDVGNANRGAGGNYGAGGAGNRDMSGARNASAFDSRGGGAQAQNFSNRGASSMNSARSSGNYGGGARSSGGGGGARAGGGGGGARGGGGGGRGGGGRR
jgi:hypothetical protein